VFSLTSLDWFAQEELEHALARGATIHAEVLGGSYTCDAHHMTEPNPTGEGVALCIRRALADAGITPAEVSEPAEFRRPSASSISNRVHCRVWPCNGRRSALGMCGSWWTTVRWR
jgi:hypothetical protein